MPSEKIDSDKVRFVGKHSKDGSLSIYLQKRNIYELEGEPCEQLGCIIRFKPDKLPKERVLIVGVLARFVYDFGFQYAETVLYQVETQLYPPLDSSHQPHPENVGGVFDLKTRFVTSLPDDHHIPLLIKLPKGSPPSIHMRSSGPAGSQWGLTYYVFAYTTNEKAALSTLRKNSYGGAWPRLKLGRRHSKVFVSFTKTFVASIERIHRSLPSSNGSKKRTGFLNSGSPLVLQASLDKPAYFQGEPILVHLRIQNPSSQRIGGVRITLKQVVTAKFGSEPRQMLKTVISEYEGDEHTVKDATFFEKNFKVFPKLNSIPEPYQLSMESKLPSGPESTKELAASIFCCGNHITGPSFGLDTLKICSVEYYINVHAIIPWSSNLIVKLPFQLVSNGGEDRKFPDPLSPHQSPTIGDAPPSFSHSFQHNNDEKTFLENLKGQPSRPPPIQGDLITFDADDFEGDDLDIGHDDEKPVPSSLIDNQFMSSFSSENTQKAPIPHSNVGSGHEGLSWTGDINTAMAILDSTRPSIREKHEFVLSRPLDSHTLLLQMTSTRRFQLFTKFIDQINALITQDVVDLKSSLMLSRNVDAASPKFYAFQAFSFRLANIGEAHAEIASLNSSNDELEERLESFCQIMDDFELLLVRAGRDSIDDASIVADRISIKINRLINDLPFYKKISSAIKLILNVCLSRKWILSRRHSSSLGFSIQEEDVDSDDEFADALDEESRFSNASELLATMAQQFQNIYDQVIDIYDLQSEEMENFADNLCSYCHNLSQLLLLSENEETLIMGQIAYYNCKFLFSVADCLYLGSSTAGPSRLLLNIQKTSFKWSKDIEDIISARYLLETQPKLEDSANLIVDAMRNLDL